MEETIYYDIETTGLNPENDRIIEIAAYNDKTDGSFSSLVHPEKSIPAESTSVHGITDGDVANAKPFSEVGKAFVEFCREGSVLVAHNGDEFDKLFLQNSLTRANIAIPQWHHVDSLKFFKKYWPNIPRYSLQYLRKYYQVEERKAHRALNDVMTLRDIFSFAIDDLPIRLVIELLNPEQPIDRMPFGKHKGMLLEQLPSGYIKYLFKEGVLDKKNFRNLKTALMGKNLYPH